MLILKVFTLIKYKIYKEIYLKEERIQRETKKLENCYDAMFPKRDKKKNFLKLHMEGFCNIENSDLFKHYYRYQFS